METVATVLVIAAGVLLTAPWVIYPLWLRLRGGAEPRRLGGAPRAHWPSLTIVVVVRNAETSVRHLLQNLLSCAYPPDRRQILVVSDASNDFTDAAVRLFADKGVSLLRTTWPRGVETAINIARRWVRSDLVVVVDPAARLRPWSLAALVAPFAERSVGMVYGRELTAENGAARRAHETLYWRYESWLRDLETRVFGTVSARGSLYAVRTPLFRAPVPSWLNADLAMTLTAREHGYRAVYEADAECAVPDLASDRRGYEQTVRVIARDIGTVFFKRFLLNPRRYGAFAWMLLAHKLGHWMTPWALLLGAVGLLLLAPAAGLAPGMLLALLGVVVAGTLVMPAVSRRLWARASAPWRMITSAVAFAHASLRAALEPPALHPAAFPPLARPSLRQSFRTA